MSKVEHNARSETAQHAAVPPALLVRGLARRHWTKPFLIGVVIAFCVLVVALFLKETAGSQERRSALLSVQRMPFARVLHEIGTIEALNETVVLSRITGDIVWKEDDGKLVEAGDPIVRFETRTLQEDLESREKDVADKIEALRRAKESVAATKKRAEYVIRQAEIQCELAVLERDRINSSPRDDERKDADLTLKSAELELDRARVDTEGYQDLARRGYVSEATRKEKELDLELKRANHKKAKLIYELTVAGYPSDTKRVAELAVADAQKRLNIAKFNRDADLAVAEAAYELAKVDLANGERELNRRRQDLGWATVRAPVRGHVVFVEVYKGSSKNKSVIQVGESRSAGGDLCIICDTSTLRVRTWINESDMQHVAVGQRALVRLSAFPGRSYEATVSELAVPATDKNVALSSLALRRSGEAFVNVVQAKLEFVNLAEADRKEIRVGFTADVCIQTTPVSEAVVVPWAGVCYGPDGAPYAEVAAGGGRERRALTLGRSDPHRVEVLQGLKEKEQVYDQTGAARPGLIVPAQVYCETAAAGGGS